MRHHKPDHDGHSPGEGLEPLVRISDPTEANVLAAMLHGEGIPVRLHGESFGPYPVMVGELAEVEVWVGSEHMDAARAVLERFKD